MPEINFSRRGALRDAILAYIAASKAIAEIEADDADAS